MELSTFAYKKTPSLSLETKLSVVPLYFRKLPSFLFFDLTCTTRTKATSFTFVSSQTHFIQTILKTAFSRWRSLSNNWILNYSFVHSLFLINAQPQIHIYICLYHMRFLFICQSFFLKSNFPLLYLGGRIELLFVCIVSLPIS